MDTIRKQLVDDKRAQDIFPRVRSRLSGERIKTNERYLSLLIDEVNKYFADLSTCTIDSNDLPTAKNGPISEKHNKLLMNIATDVDKVHGKRIEVQDMITKAANYLSTERVSLNNAVSKMHARVINQKLRSSMNDRHLTVFTEYFTDDNYVDKGLTNNMVVDPSISALTLTPLVKTEDNSNLIDTTSIYIEATLNNNNQQAAAIYPFGGQPKAIPGPSNEGIYYCGFGRTLANEDVTTQLANLNAAGYMDPGSYEVIQSQCLAIGVAGGEDKFTHGEFELIFNDFDSKKIDTTIKQAIKKSSLNTTKFDIHDDNIVIETDTGLSFNDAKSGNSTDFNDLKSLITSIGLRFSLSNILKGQLSYIRLNFAPPTDVVAIPKINYDKSYIKDVDGKIYYSFTEMSLNETTNEVVESKFLLLDLPVSNPKEFYIDFDLSSLKVEDIKVYKGVVWKVRLHGEEVKGTTEYTGVLANSVSNQYKYYYHDIHRTANISSANGLNLDRLNSILSHNGVSLTTVS